MQIPPSGAAAQAAGIVSQAASKDPQAAAGADAAGAKALGQATVEKAEESNPDRDAQGQGDGTTGLPRRITDENEVEGADETETPTPSSPNPPGDPPSQLDIVG